MRVGVVHTKGSPCRCAESVAGGLAALGHEARIVDSEEIELRASALARECDLVIDHTDTWKGRGVLRSLVRLFLEARGARIVGSDARACALADDKVATKEWLEAAGIPTPHGTVVSSLPVHLPPERYEPPFVLKPAFEHMSRGLSVATSRAEAAEIAAGLLETMRQPILVEPFVAGRELAVSVLDGPEEAEGGGPSVRPVLEWRLPGGGHGVLTSEHKLRESPCRSEDAARADLEPLVLAAVEVHARRAFRALGLRDYARFDVRLAADGTPFFLEANTRPSLEPCEALALSASWAGMAYPALVARLLSSALARCR